MKRCKQLLIQCALAATLVGTAGLAHAELGDPSTRDWLPAPEGTNLIVSYAFDLRSRGLYDNGTRVPGAKVGLRGMILRPMTYRKIGGMTVQPEAILPLIRTSYSEPGFKDHKFGVGDLTLGMAIWPYENEETATWFAYEPLLTLPIGQYDSGNADLSAGGNRWVLANDFAFIKGFGESTFLELEYELVLYGRNSNYYGARLSQRPTHNFFAMLSTNLTPRLAIGGRYKYSTGGAIKLNSVAVPGSRNQVHELSLDLTYDLNDHNQLQVLYMHPFKVKNGPRLRGIQARWAYIF